MPGQYELDDVLQTILMAQERTVAMANGVDSADPLSKQILVQLATLQNILIEKISEMKVGKQ